MEYISSDSHKAVIKSLEDIMEKKKTNKESAEFVASTGTAI